jgi:hypothetical protein
MNFKGIISGLRPLFNEDEQWRFTPVGKKVKEIFYTAKGIDLNDSRVLETEIEGLKVLFIDKKVDDGHIKKLFDYNKTFDYIDYNDVIYLNNGIVFVIFINDIINIDEKHEDMSDIFGKVYMTVSNLINYIYPNNLTDFKSFCINRSFIYMGVQLINILTLTIKIMQANVINFNKSDIERYLDKYKCYDKDIFNQFIDLCFKESIENLLERSMIYEYSIKLHSKI